MIVNDDGIVGGTDVGNTIVWVDNNYNGFNGTSIIPSIDSHSYLKALHIMGEMLKYIKPMVSDEKFLKMMEEFEEEMHHYDFEEEEDEVKKDKEVEELFVL